MKRKIIYIISIDTVYTVYLLSCSQIYNCFWLFTFFIMTLSVVVFHHLVTSWAFIFFVIPFFSLILYDASFYLHQTLSADEY